MFKKILVPIDGSFPSVVAQELTAFIAKKLGSEVTVIHVISHELMHPQLRGFSPERDHPYVGVTTGDLSVPWVKKIPETPAASLQDEVYREVSSWYRQNGESALASAVTLFREEGISANQELVEHSDPAHIIIQEAEKGKYSLIVVGCSGEKEEELHLGSVAEKVSLHAKTPVLIAREKSKISKILVPVDGSERAEKALQYAVLLAQKTDAEITILYVQETGIFKLKPEMSEKIGKSILSKAAEQVKGVKLQQKLESGDPAKIITQTANKENHDLIIMGSKGHSTIARFLLGSVTDHVIHYANHSVLIVR
jgi:nucleotide-binding universal stress UspA family protein